MYSMYDVVCNAQTLEQTFQMIEDYFSDDGEQRVNNDVWIELTFSVLYQKGRQGMRKSQKKRLDDLCMQIMGLVDTTTGSSHFLMLWLER